MSLEDTQATAGNERASDEQPTRNEAVGTPQALLGRDRRSAPRRFCCQQLFRRLVAEGPLLAVGDRLDCARRPRRERPGTPWRRWRGGRPAPGCIRRCRARRSGPRSGTGPSGYFFSHSALAARRRAGVVAQIGLCRSRRTRPSRYPRAVDRGDRPPERPPCVTSPASERRRQEAARSSTEAGCGLLRGVVADAVVVGRLLRATDCHQAAAAAAKNARNVVPVRLLIVPLLVPLRSASAMS